MARYKPDCNYIYDQLEQMFPDAHCQLDYGSIFQLAVAVMLSAQTTDVSVNKVTPALFARYPDAFAMGQADQKDVEEMIRSIGLYRNKAASVIAMSRQLVEEYDGVVPNEMDKLTLLRGIGRKSANVILSEGYKIPAIAVDTHVHRVSIRLYLANENDDVDQVEKKLMKQFSKDRWSRLHHLLIFFGRYQCSSRNPHCEDCPFKQHCRYLKGKEQL
ncbi:MAG: endonuclease III [Erysipelotrichaceae bacterium]|nr:endonuclease III [Erysipelotrichaceae bacterium]